MRSKLALASALGFLLTFPALAQCPGALATLFVKDPGSLSTTAPSLAPQEDYTFRQQTCTFDYQCFCPADATCACVDNVCQVSGSSGGGGLSSIDCNGNVTFCHQTSECGYCSSAGICFNNICYF